LGAVGCNLGHGFLSHLGSPRKLLFPIVTASTSLRRAALSQYAGIYAQFFSYIVKQFPALN
jgi:hypothetical protein